MFTIDSNSSIQKNTDFSHVKSRSIDNISDRKSIGSITSLNTSASSIQPVKNDKDNRMSSSVGNITNSLNAQPVRQSVQLNKNEPPSLSKWIKKEGPVKLHEALANLNLDAKSIERVNLSAFSFDQLANEKKNVKNELKNYDAEFAIVFKRNPEREEKEPMRPLYIYYKRIKQYMAKNAAKARNNKAMSTSSGQVNASANVGDKNGKMSKSSKNYGYEKENKQYGQPDRRMDNSFEGQISKDGFKERNSYNLDEERKEYGEKNSRQSVGKGQGNTGFMNQEQIRRQLEEYKGFRLQLREKLHSYQTEFTKNNSRKIKYHKDIAPVENEYKHYKEIKQEISRLEGLLGSYA